MTSRNFLGSSAVSATSNTNSNPFQAAISARFSSTVWMTSYRYFRAADGLQPSGAQRFATWQVTGSTGSLTNFTRAAELDALSGALALGWNGDNPAIPPTAGPQALSASVEYQFETAFTGRFVEAQNQFSTGGPYAAGITSGAGFVFSDPSGTAPDAFNNPQGWFDDATADPRSEPATQGFNAGNFGIDVWFSDVMPAGVALRLWPAQPHPVNFANDTADNFTIATEFWLSSQFPSYYLLGIEYFSPPAVSQLATESGIWAVQGQSLITATHQTSPSWINYPALGAASPGAGWVTAAYSPPYPVLAPGKYKASVFNGSISPAVWNATTTGYWQSPGAGASGQQVGPLSAPSNTAATSPGQSTYHLGASFAWPDTYSAPSNSATYWVRPVILPKASSGLMVATGLV